MGRATHRVRACSLQELPPGTARKLRIAFPAIAIFNLDGTVYAVEDLCTHAFALLSEGRVEGTSVRCPLHRSQFDVRTGEPLCGPATESLRTYEVEVIAGEVIVHIETSLFGTSA
ncbi:bifunctional 3-phenylpropionate/cinnamic acid dioxygenase ferredoxin subunit [Saccharopolyspora gloriosae]|uniref:bifunctional 3-phenylpropionate/cinnamic acid dioxygenase ferredoxin subunit n=1 Tax=Saccharopolyspora gloriosae TaxID=455344 RepID=UPI001FB767F0|nr:bifunctional 3-phenylpropionate/cinnamic acid dioxygenase ferredoxin subunit [Saccharopolyspora gloriosae]